LQAFLTRAEMWTAQHQIRCARIRAEAPLVDAFMKELRAARLVA